MEKCPVPPNSRVDLKGVCSSGSIGKNISKDVKLDPGYNSKEQDPNWHYIFPSVCFRMRVLCYNSQLNQQMPEVIQKMEKHG